ncbi:MAG: nickel pincer cofactor biosynthesis protein LarC, partial [Clostridia bacterium]|nr:nickel pincer cofactor biosynthesis protein LarC [Clostridia bacterium]
INHLGLPGVKVDAETSVKCGITGTHMKVTVNGEEEESRDAHSSPHEHAHEHSHGQDHEHHSDDPAHGDHHHASPADVEELINGLNVSDQVKADAKAVYALIAEAESHVHGHPVSEIHFHEVGTLDAVTDVISVCLLMEEISAEEVVVSPVHVGSGHVHCMHGILPVPAPATALILKDVPTYGGHIQGELCTPTGAALLKHFASRFGDRPIMRTKAIGYGMGKKDFEQANCVRAFLGESERQREQITKLECNLDDMTGEDIGFATEQLFQAGAKEVFTQAVGMKKNRPGILLTVLCLTEDADRLAEEMMKHTSTLGIRRQEMSRYVLQRSVETLSISYGEVRMKQASGMGVKRSKPEFEDVAALARKYQVPLRTIREKITEEANEPAGQKEDSHS